MLKPFNKLSGRVLFRVFGIEQQRIESGFELWVVGWDWRVGFDCVFNVHVCSVGDIE